MQANKAEQKTFYRQGYGLSITNSQGLLNVAEKAADTGEFGIACSLCILSAEEAIKAQFILIKYVFPDTNIEDFDAIFRDHKIKHDHIKYALFLQEIANKEMRKSLKEFSEYLPLIERLPKNERDNLKRKLKPLYNSWEMMKRSETKKIPSQEILDWWEKANLEKNRGLYVDKINDQWHDPRNYSKEKFDGNKKIAEAIIVAAKQLDHLIINTIEIEKIVGRDKDSPFSI